LIPAPLALETEPAETGSRVRRGHAQRLIGRAARLRSITEKNAK
jgi:hypothetical protein